MNIANQGFPAFRADLNAALEALVSSNSGATAPATTFANMPWYDTANNIFKIRNEDNDAWISIFTLDQSTDAITAIGSVTLADVVSLTGTQTLTNKTLTSPAINGQTVDKITDTQGGVFAPTSSVMRNRIINGDMRIDQRNNGASVTGNNYPVDRWIVAVSQSSKLTAQQNAGAVTPPVGFPNYVGITSSSSYSVTSSDYFLLGQSIEGFNTADLGWGSANASSITVSFWVRSSLTGTFGGVVQNNDQSRSYPFTYAISAANTWEKKSVTIAGDTTGTWNPTNATGIRLWLGLGVGSTFSGTAGAWASANFNTATGATSIVGTSGATFYITGVQLEKGTQATSFEYRQYGQELALCQRYTQVFGGDSNYNTVGTLGIAQSATTVGYYSFPLATQLRANPSLSYSGNWRVDDGYTASYAVTNIGIDGISLNRTNAVLAINVASGLTSGRPYQLQANNSTASRIILSSEL